MLRRFIFLIRGRKLEIPRVTSKEELADPFFNRYRQQLLSPWPYNGQKSDALTHPTNIHVQKYERQKCSNQTTGLIWQYLLPWTSWSVFTPKAPVQHLFKYCPFKNQKSVVKLSESFLTTCTRMDFMIKSYIILLERVFCAIMSGFYFSNNNGIEWSLSPTLEAFWQCCSRCNVFIQFLGEIFLVICTYI